MHKNQGRRPTEKDKKQAQLEHLQTAIGALETRNDRDNKADCKLANLMQVKDQKYVAEHKYTIFRQKQKETGAVTQIKRKEEADQAV